MTNRLKLIIAVTAACTLGLVAWIGFEQANKGVIIVETAVAARENLVSVVTASGEIKPRTYANVMAEGFGEITKIAVNEGDHVKAGDILLRLEDIQPAADVAAQQATIASADASAKSSEANRTSAEADVAQRKADLEHSRLDWERGQELFKQGLIPKQDYDTRKTGYDGAVAALAASEARLAQSEADLARARSAIVQTQAVLAHAEDVLKKTTYQAPINGVVTYIAVRVGENVVPGIQNSNGSYLMTISDMSHVTAEVMVDETDIVNVTTGQAAAVTIDAIPGQSFQGHVVEVGTQAVLRTSGLASTQSTTGNQEAKDFKVIVSLDDPPDGLRPGLSASAKITTAQKANVVAVPIQAVAVRTRRELADAGQGDKGGVTLAAGRQPANNDEIQGIFVVRGNKATFVPVQTGISGVNDIEVTGGIAEGDQIVIGTYKALRTLRPTATVKVDNKHHDSYGGSGDNAL